MAPKTWNKLETLHDLMVLSSLSWSPPSHAHTSYLTCWTSVLVSHTFKAFTFTLPLNPVVSFLKRWYGFVTILGKCTCAIHAHLSTANKHWGWLTKAKVLVFSFKWSDIRGIFKILNTKLSVLLKKQDCCSFTTEVVQIPFPLTLKISKYSNLKVGFMSVLWQNTPNACSPLTKP